LFVINDHDNDNDNGKKENGIEGFCAFPQNDKPRHLSFWIATGLQRAPRNDDASYEIADQVRNDDASHEIADQVRNDEGGVRSDAGSTL
jgi:hypothetical protein